MKKLVLFVSTNFDRSRVNNNFFNGSYNHLFDEIKIYSENDLPDNIKENINKMEFIKNSKEKKLIKNKSNNIINNKVKVEDPEGFDNEDYPTGDSFDDIL